MLRRRHARPEHVLRLLEQYFPRHETSDSVVEREDDPGFFEARIPLLRRIDQSTAQRPCSRTH